MKVLLDQETLEFVVRKKAEQAALNFGLAPANLNRLEQLENVVKVASLMPFSVNLWEVQNLFAQNINGIYSNTRAQAEQGDEAARAWIEHFNALAKTLRLRV